MKQWRESNKEKLKLYRKTTYLNCKEESNRKSKEYYHLHKEELQKVNRKYHENNPKQRMLASGKSNAKQRGCDFNLELDDIIIPEYCPILKIPLTTMRGKGRIESNASIDRIDSSKGYTKDNIQIISDLANRMKQNASREQLIAFAKGVLELYD